MSKQSPDNNPVEISSLDFGPSWARKNDSPKKEYRSYDGEKGGKRRSPKGGGGGGRGRPSGGGDRDFKGRPPRKDFKGGGRRPQPKFTPAEPGIETSIMPIEEGVDNLAKEIIAAGRTYSVFELARVVLGARERFSIIFTKKNKDANDGNAGPDMFQCKLDGAVFFTKDECMNHSAGAEWINTLYKAEELDVDPPAGNFQNVAKCGFSGELLGPTNFHGYQDRVQELHRTKFSNMSIDQYKNRIVSESGEEIVNVWKESMKKRTIYKLITDESVVFDSKTAMLQHFSTEGINDVFHRTHKAQVPSDIDAKKLSPSLLTNLKELIQEQRRYPGVLSSFLCRQLSGRQLAVYKWQGKLHCGPSRPHQIPEDLKMAERPSTIFQWVNEHVGGGIDELWKSVCPENIEEKEKYEWYHDLHWLINEGYVVFMNSGHLYPSSASKKPVKQEQKKDQKKAEPKKTEAKKTKVKKETKVETETKAETKVEAKSEVKQEAPKEEVTSEMKPVEDSTESKDSK